jgi:DNA topoisomerase IA
VTLRRESARRSWTSRPSERNAARVGEQRGLRQAFNKLKPNRELRPLYEAAVARQQADQIFNLSLTRTATRTLLAGGVRGVIGIGRVKTPYGQKIGTAEELVLYRAIELAGAPELGRRV